MDKPIKRLEAKIVVYSVNLTETELANILEEALSSEIPNGSINYFLPPLTKSKQITREQFEQEADRNSDELFKELDVVT